MFEALRFQPAADDNNLIYNLQLINYTCDDCFKWIIYKV